MIHISWVPWNVKIKFSLKRPSLYCLIHFYKRFIMSGKALLAITQHRQRLTAFQKNLIQKRHEMEEESSDDDFCLSTPKNEKTSSKKRNKENCPPVESDTSEGETFNNASQQTVKARRMSMGSSKEAPSPLGTSPVRISPLRTSPVSISPVRTSPVRQSKNRWRARGECKGCKNRRWCERLERKSVPVKCKRCKKSYANKRSLVQHNKDYPDCVELTGNRFRAESKSYKQNYYCKDSKCVAKARKFSSMKEFLGHHTRRHRDEGKEKEFTAVFIGNCHCRIELKTL